MKYTPIGWTHSTINGSSGCDGCELWSGHTRTCYAGRLHEGRLALANPSLYAANFSEVRMIPGRLAKAASWRPPTPEENVDKPWFTGAPRHIFVGDMADFLSEGVSDEFLDRELLSAITSSGGRRHVWQLLTKRPRRLVEVADRWGGLPENVVAMTTITNQRTADIRVPALRRVRCATRGLSVEPLLEGVDVPLEGIDWVIVGGESGPGCRPMQRDWVTAIRDRCDAAGVPFFFKQWGGVDKAAHGRLLDGRTYDGIPQTPIRAVEREALSGRPNG